MNCRGCGAPWLANNVGQCRACGYAETHAGDKPKAQQRCEWTGCDADAITHTGSRWLCVEHLDAVLVERDTLSWAHREMLEGVARQAKATEGKR